MVAASELVIAETPIAIVDVETTGLNPESDRVVEISVLRKDPGAEPELIFDSLVNPMRRMGATEIHGIQGADVEDAPLFANLAKPLAASLSGCVVAAYNAYFDMKFLTREFARNGMFNEMPHICLMYFRPLLDLGKRCSLGDACREHGISHEFAHAASVDAWAASRLWEVYLREIARRGIVRFGELESCRSYKFLESLAYPLLTAGPRDREFQSKSRVDQLWGSRIAATPARADAVIEAAAEPARKGFREYWKAFKTVGGDLAPTASSQAKGSVDLRAEPAPKQLREYWEELKTVIADLQVTGDESGALLSKRIELGLSIEQVRMYHARAFASVIGQFIEDEWLDDREAEKLHRLARCLRQLGWAPGD